MSIGNEPDFASCGRTEPCNGNYPTTLYTANEMVVFIKVGAEAEGAGDQGHRARGLGVDPQLVEQLGRRFGAG